MPKNEKMIEWLNTFYDLVSSRYPVDVADLKNAAEEVTMLEDFDPSFTLPSATSATSASSDMNKKQKVGEDNGDNVKILKPIGDTTALTGDAALAFVNKQVSTGNWRLERASAVRKGWKDKPDETHEFEFVLDAADRSAFDHKNVIKEAGFYHYSMNTSNGWAAFPLKGGKKGFGRPVK